MALALVAFAACGPKGETGNGETETKGGEEQAKGTVETWGVITVLIPEGMSLKGGSLLDSESKNDATIMGAANDYSEYFMISVKDSEDTVKDSIDMTREINDDVKIDDVTETLDGVEWKGITYESLGIRVYVVYAEIGGQFVQVTGTGHTYDDATSVAILKSVKLG